GFLSSALPTHPAQGLPVAAPAPLPFWLAEPSQVLSYGPPWLAPCPVSLWWVPSQAAFLFLLVVVVPPVPVVVLVGTVMVSTTWPSAATPVAELNSRWEAPLSTLNGTSLV